MNYYTVCPDCGYKLLKAGFGSKHATKATGKEQVPPVAFCVKPHASPCASLRRIGHRNSDASLHSAIPSSLCSSLQIPLSAPTLRASAQACRKKRQVRKVFPPVAFLRLAPASPCAPLRRIGHRNSDASLHSAIPSLRSLQIPLSAPTLQAWLEANQNGSLAQVPLPFLCALLPALSASLRSIGHRNSDASLHSAILSLRSLQIPLSANMFSVPFCWRACLRFSTSWRPSLV